MNRFPRFLNAILIGYAAIIAAGCSQVRDNGVLIYSDHTPGSLAYYEVERRVAVGKGHTVTTVTEVPAFEQQLATGDWEYVVAIAEYASGEPAYADELRDYSEADHPVHMWIWHDNGTNPGTDTVVMGTTAIVYWSTIGHTTIAYAHATGPKATATTTSGLTFPDFSGITIIDPTIIVQAAPEQIQELSSGAIIESVPALSSKQACLDKCLDKWNDDVSRCEDIHEMQSGHCDAQYPVPPIGNVLELNQCLDDAIDNEAKCRRSASSTYKGCAAECGSEEGE